MVFLIDPPRHTYHRSRLGVEGKRASGGGREGRKGEGKERRRKGGKVSGKGDCVEEWRREEHRNNKWESFSMNHVVRSFRTDR